MSDSDIAAKAALETLLGMGIPIEQASQLAELAMNNKQLVADSEAEGQAATMLIMAMVDPLVERHGKPPVASMLMYVAAVLAEQSGMSEDWLPSMLAHMQKVAKEIEHGHR